MGRLVMRAHLPLGGGHHAVISAYRPALRTDAGRGRACSAAAAGARGGAGLAAARRGTALCGGGRLFPDRRTPPAAKPGGALGAVSVDVVRIAGPSRPGTGDAQAAPLQRAAESFSGRPPSPATIWRSMPTRCEILAAMAADIDSARQRSVLVEFYIWNEGGLTEEVLRGAGPGRAAAASPASCWSMPWGRGAGGRATSPACCARRACSCAPRCRWVC